VYDDRGDRRGNQTHDAAQEDHRRCTGEQRDGDPMPSEQVLIRALGDVVRGSTLRPLRVGARRHQGAKG